MDQESRTDTTTDQLDVDSPVVEATSTEYLGRWNRLISTTNWSKGQIICQWREKLVEADAPANSYTDEAWSRWVGNVSPQHAGRLRRVYQRFSETHEKYAGLHWSHFQAALDWNDAEMWLEGAVQDGWSIAQMRHKRWESIGAPADKKPREEDIITGEVDEDVDPKADGEVAETISATPAMVQDAEDAPQDDIESGEFNEADDSAPWEGESSQDDQQAAEPARPFENLGTLPNDLNDAFEAFKLAIIHHRLAGWQDVSCDTVLETLNALKQLALAPTDDQG
ncbi:MAG TPA: hypothetical protein VE890_02840 [Thermoguttaceae bacterium]|nr:hypothetical protein [Thermoguttaceae bacterium]